MQDYIIQSIQEGNQAQRKYPEQPANAYRHRNRRQSDSTSPSTRAQKSCFAVTVGSAADAQHIAAELVGRFVTEREGLPATRHDNRHFHPDRSQQ